MLLYITILGFIVTALLLFNIKQSNSANIYLILFFLTNNIYAFTHYATVYSHNRYLIAILITNFAFIYMLIGPFLYFYVRGVLVDDYRLSNKDYLHFIPAIIVLINNIKHIFSSWESKLIYADGIILHAEKILNFDHVFFSGPVLFIVRPVVGMIYLFLSARLVYIHYAKNSSQEKQSDLFLKWAITLLSVTFIMYLTFLIFSIISVKTGSYLTAEKSAKYILFGTLTGLFILNLSLLFFPNILYGLPQLDYVIPNHKTQISAVDSKLSDSLKEEKRLNKGFEISHEKLQLLKYKVDKYCETQPYLRFEFSLNTMSADTDIPVHHLSYFFNEFLQVNFITWKNDLKIAHVIQLIHNGSSEILTLDALAKQAGFGSRTTFFNAFKQKMGMTPSEYLSSLE